MGVQRVRPILDFTRGWHRTHWAIATLRRDLGANLIRWPTGPDLLGAVAIGPTSATIMLADWVEGTPLALPIVAHECAHLLQGVSGFCLGGADRRLEEREAAYGSALLAVPLEAVRRLLPVDPADRHTLEDLGVPWQLLAMRAALAVLLGERTGSRMSARLTLEVAHRSLQRWITQTAATH